MNQGFQVFCCKELMMSKFCPNCGTSFDEAQKKCQSPYPVKFMTSLHGTGREDEDKEAFIKSLGLKNESAVEDIERCDYEINIVWQKDNAELPPRPIALIKGRTTYLLSICLGDEQKAIMKDIF